VYIAVKAGYKTHPARTRRTARVPREGAGEHQTSVRFGFDVRRVCFSISSCATDADRSCSSTGDEGPTSVSSSSWASVWLQSLAMLVCTIISTRMMTKRMAMADEVG